MALERTAVGAYRTTTAPVKADWSTSSFTPPANSLLLIHVYAMGNGGEVDLGNLSKIEGGGLAYSLQSAGTITLTPAWCMKGLLYTAPVGGSPESMTITINGSANREIYCYVLTVTAFTGYDAAEPLGGTLTSGSTNIGDGAESRELNAAPREGDQTIMGVYVDASLGPPNPTEEAGWELVQEAAGGAAIKEGGLAVEARSASTSKTVAVADTHTAGGSFAKAGMNAVVVREGEEEGPEPQSIAPDADIEEEGEGGAWTGAYTDLADEEDSTYMKATLA